MKRRLFPVLAMLVALPGMALGQPRAEVARWAAILKATGFKAQ